MSHRHELDQHRRKLGDIRNIMYSMKTLALMETHKLARYIKAQSEISSTIEGMATDLLYFHPDVLPAVTSSSDIILLIGSERGFCGNFNESLVQKLQQFHASTDNNDNTVIVIGQKLHALLNITVCNIIFIEGADVTEDIYRVVGELARTLAGIRKSASLFAIYHNSEKEGLYTEKLLPPFDNISRDHVKLTSPPLLNLSTTDFFLDLTDHYLYSALHRVLYSSLMAENESRVEHLEHATRHLDDKTEELGLKINALRQEEIIEEIEVILLNSISS